MLIFLGATLDPRHKMVIVKYAFPLIYGENSAPKYIDEVMRILCELYEEYVSVHISSKARQLLQ